MTVEPVNSAEGKVLWGPQVARMVPTFKSEKGSPSSWMSWSGKGTTARGGFSPHQGAGPGKRASGL